MVRKIQLIVNMYVVLKIRYIFYSKVICMAQWLSWLERRPVTAEVVSSSLIWVVYGVLAQLGEHLPYKQRVIGSSPIGPIKYGEIAQLARAHGSYPWCRGFESPSRYLTEKSVERIWDLSSAGRASALQAEGHRFEPCRSHLKLIKLNMPMWLNWQSS